MSSSAVLPQREKLGLKACPVCGKAPRLIETRFGTCFIQCFPHAETRTVESIEDAVRLWNHGQLLGRLVESQTDPVPTFA